MPALSIRDRAAELRSAAFAGFLRAAFVERFREWRRRRSLREMLEFDPHILDDIGYEREDIRQALALPFDRNAAASLQRHARERRARELRNLARRHREPGSLTASR